MEGLDSQVSTLIKCGFEFNQIVDMLTKHYQNRFTIDDLFVIKNIRNEMYKKASYYPFIELNEDLDETNGISFDIQTKNKKGDLLILENKIIIMGLISEKVSEIVSPFHFVSYEGECYKEFIKNQISNLIEKASFSVNTLKIDDTCGCYSLEDVKDLDIYCNKKYNIKIQIIKRDIIYNYMEESYTPDRIIPRLLLLNLSKFESLNLKEIIEFNKSLMDCVNKKMPKKLFDFVSNHSELNI